eukprot:457481-Rhodomonas_salina.4
MPSAWLTHMLSLQATSRSRSALTSPPHGAAPSLAFSHSTLSAGLAFSGLALFRCCFAAVSRCDAGVQQR